MIYYLFYQNFLGFLSLEQLEGLFPLNGLLSKYFHLFSRNFCDHFFDWIFHLHKMKMIFFFLYLVSFVIKFCVIILLFRCPHKLFASYFYHWLTKLFYYYFKLVVFAVLKSFPEIFFLEYQTMLIFCVYFHQLLSFYS